MRLQTILRGLVAIVFLLVLSGGAYDTVVQSPQLIQPAPLLPLLDEWQDASTECEDAVTDISYSAAATASLPCADTGEYTGASL